MPTESVSVQNLTSLRLRLFSPTWTSQKLRQCAADLLSTPDTSQILVDLLEHRSPSAATGHRYPDLAYRHPNLRANLEQLQTDRPALRLRHLGPLQSQPPQRLHQTISKGREIQAQLIGAHHRSGRAIGEQRQLLFLDPVFHLSPGAVKLLV